MRHGRSSKKWVDGFWAGSPPKHTGLPEVAVLAELARRLVQAKDWARATSRAKGWTWRLRTVALAMTVDPKAAVRLLGKFANGRTKQGRGYPKVARREQGTTRRLPHPEYMT